MKRRSFSAGRVALTLSLLLFPAGALAQTAQPPPVAEASSPAPSGQAQAAAPGATTGADSGGSLRERVTRLEEGLKGAQRQLERMEEDQAKLKERLDDQRTQLLVSLMAAGGTIAAALWGVVAFFNRKLSKGIEERGHEAVVSAVIDRLFADQATRFSGLFEAHRKEITRAVMARDRAIALVGDHPDAGRIKEMLTSMGYSRLSSDATEAELVLLLGAKACAEQGAALVDQVARDGRQKWFVLYTASERLDAAVIDRLNRVGLAIPANVPATAASHMAMLAVLTQSLR